MFRKEFLLIIKSIKNRIFYILKILIKILNVWARMPFYHKKYKKDNILQLDNK